MNNLSQRDKTIMWHPFTQEKTAPDVIPITRAQGSYVYDENDKAYLDLISSWWVNLHGHAHPVIAHSIYKQALELEHVLFAGFTHLPAVQLCEELCEILPDELNRFFFSDNGSTAVEVALKMAYQYWHNKGQNQRSIFLSFDGGYHGDTFGAMSVSAKSGFHDNFSKLFFQVLNIPYPDTWDDDQEIEQKEEYALHVLDQHLREYTGQIAAIIIEPLIQGAGGMRTCRVKFIEEMLRRIKSYDILIIFDEIMTGFGRTGGYFALEKISLRPDFICLSKGITGGFLPLALTVTSNRIYEAFLNDEWKYAFAHGHSYTANPLACAAAISSLKILRSQECQESIQAIHKSHQKSLQLMKSRCPRAVKTRVLGTICAFETNNQDLKIDDKQLNDYFISSFAEAGLLLRRLKNVIYLMPPYSTKPGELENAVEKIVDIINTL